jgi:transcriptional regulator with XRE-family HTH domain
MLAAARMRHGWPRREAARLLEVSPSYLFDLEAGRRCPSVTVAGQLADGLGLDETERAQLLAATVDDAGRDHPVRHSA